MLEKIRSEYFLNYLCRHIKKRDKILRIFNYNKIMQKKLKITIQDYKNIFNQIIIEVIPGIPKNNIRENVFIRIIRNCFNYYHIYFDDCENEIKRNYLEYNEKIKRKKI